MQKLITLIAICLMAVLVSGSLTACGGSADAAKNEKKKKSKKVVEEEEEETSEEPKAEEEKKEGAADEKKDAKPTEPGKEEPKPDFEKMWANLAAGNRRFMSGKHTTVNYASMRTALSKEQHPEIIVLGCSDSRVPPEFIFDKNLGELFVIRDAGNIPDEVSLGSIEYAVEHLHAKMIVVLGHESCGAVAAAVSGDAMPSRNLDAIVELIKPALEGKKECQPGQKPNIACVGHNVNHTVELLLERSKIIKKALEEKHIEIVSAVYHFDTGEVHRIDR